MSELLKHHEQAAFHFGTLLHGIGDRYVWDDPTPDTGWTVRDLVNHLVVEALWVPPLVAGQTIDEVGDRFDGDQLGDDPAARWDAAAEGARKAIAEASMDVVVHLSYGDTPLQDYATQFTQDIVIHGWDLARALNADDAIDPELLAWTLAGTRENAADIAASGVTGPPIDVPGSADDQTQLLALWGRRR